MIYTNRHHQKRSFQIYNEFENIKIGQAKFELPAKTWRRQVKAWGPGANVARDKRSMVKFTVFLKTANVEIYIFVCFVS